MKSFNYLAETPFCESRNRLSYSQSQSNSQLQSPISLFALLMDQPIFPSRLRLVFLYSIILCTSSSFARLAKWVFCEIVEEFPLQVSQNGHFARPAKEIVPQDDSIKNKVNVIIYTSLSGIDSPEAIFLEFKLHCQQSLPQTCMSLEMCHAAPVITGNTR